jgi:hypothetical protein
MKTALSIVGIVFLLLIVLGAAGFGAMSYYGTQFDASSKTYVDDSVRAITTNWSPDELIKRESPQLHATVADDKIETLFSELGKLGPLQSYDGSKGDSNIHIGRRGLTISATYKADATYQNGKAEVLLYLVRESGEWEIQGFRVNPSAP